MTNGINFGLFKLTAEGSVQRSVKKPIRTDRFVAAIR